MASPSGWGSTGSRMTVASVLADGLRLVPSPLSAPGATRTTQHRRVAATPRRRFSGALEDALLLIVLAYSLPVVMLVIGAPIALLFVFLSRLVHEIATRL
ncbi:MAG: hypothetical protein ABMA15_25810 [Vicinamibacterales bacterium]